MTGTSQNRWGRRAAVAGSAVLGLLLLVSCDKRALPTQPTGPGPQGQRSTGPIAFVSDRDGTMRIYLANEDGSLVTPLVAGVSPAWARDGRRLAFTAGTSDLHVIGVDGTGDRVITDSGLQPSWSPDGRALVFLSRRDFDIAVVNVDGSNRRTLIDSDGLGSFEPTWSPDGQRIVFSTGTFFASDLGLWTVNADGSDARQLAGPGVGVPRGNQLTGEPSPFEDAGQAAWSPDGSLIAFRSELGSVKFSIEIARLDGSGRQLRVPGPAHDPDWTPDGRLIYTKGSFDAPTRIFISDGGTERQLIPEATAPARPTYSDWSAVWLR
jgi:Tol biopolymer transport system component